MHPIFIDTETTDTSEDARLVQLAYKNSDTGEVVDELFKPPVPISVGAMAVHHITNEMVQDKQSFEMSLHREKIRELLRNNILVAHNARFDISILANEGVETEQYIDTLRVSRHVIDSEQYSLQYLRYELGLTIDENVHAHDALGDILVLEKLYYNLSDSMKVKYSLSSDKEVLLKMVELTHLPVLLDEFKFGKYKGERFKDVATEDPGYIQWLYDSETKKPKSEQNEDLVYTLKNYLV